MHPMAYNVDGCAFYIGNGCTVAILILCIEAKMKIVVWKSPKYLSKLLSRLFGAENKNGK